MLPPTPSLPTSSPPLPSLPAFAPPAPLLQVCDLCHHYPSPRRALWGPAPAPVPVLSQVNLSLAAGRSLGVVGASGSGKSTLARLILGLEVPSSGLILLDEQVVNARQRQSALRQQMHMIFQDPYSALNPRRTIGWSVAEPLGTRLPAAEVAERVAQALTQVGLHPDDAQRYPQAFSGGQRQRIAIARAIITRPRLIVADEPTSALDVSVQAQVLNLLQELQATHGISYLLISHDLSVIHHMCDTVLVLDAGQVVETIASNQLLRSSAPATQALLRAVPTITPGAARRRWAGS